MTAEARVNGGPMLVETIPFAQAADDGRAWTYMLSDAHIDIGGGPALDAFERVLGAASQRGAEARVVILGDLFEFYATPGQVRVQGAWQRIGDAIRAAARAGVSVTLLRGNRDYLLDGRFARRTDSRVVPGGLVLTIDGRRVLAVHGDELCLRDLAYLKLRRRLRSPLFWFLSYALPTFASTWIGRSIRRAAKKRRGRQLDEPSGARAARGGDPGQDPLRFEPIQEAIEAALDRAGADVLVFGHVHRASRTVLDGGREVLVLPAFEGDEGHLVSGPGRPLAHVLGGAAVEAPVRLFPAMDADSLPDPAAG